MVTKGEMLENVISALQAGNTIMQACDGPNTPHRSTLRLWMLSNNDIANKILTARRLGGWALFDKLVEDADPPPGKIAAMKYLIHKLIPKECK